jgi:hypothetical protein
MKTIKTSFIYIGAFLLMTVSCLADALKLELGRVEGAIRITLINDSELRVTISQRFAMGLMREGPFNELVLEIKDSGGRLYLYIPQVRIGAPGEKDIISLRPGGYVGREIREREIVEDFGLVRGQYSVKAVFIERLGLNHEKVGGVVESNEIQLTVGGR